MATIPLGVYRQYAMSHKTHLIVLFGGESAEHDVSCVTAAHVIAAANPSAYDITAIGIDREGSWFLADSSPEALASGRLIARGNPTALPGLIRADSVVLPLLHGPLGEDGTIQGMLELANIPYVGSGVLASSLCMDKTMAKQVLRAEGLPQPRFVAVRETNFTDSHIDNIVADINLPMFVKPANMGSSVGVRRATTRDEALTAIHHAFVYDEWVVCEEAIAGREIEVAVLGNTDPQASLPGEIVPGSDFYDYEDKYVNNSAQLHIPALLDDQRITEVRALAVRIYTALRCEGMARVDFFFEPDGRGFLCNEVNTIPGFTPISMYPKMWEATGLGYASLIDQLVDLARERHSRRKRSTQVTK
jgi:D-alanine-D-alanine ligase